MKIAIIGTHGTGKTTLAYKFTGHLKEKGYNAVMIEECASKSPLGLNEAATLESQIWIIGKQMTEELEKAAKYDVVVCDRALIDSYVYTLDICNREKKKMPKWIDLLLKEHTKTYGLLFKTLLFEEGLKEDGIRSTAKEWQKEIDLLFLEVLKKNNIKYFDLPKDGQLEFIIERFLEYEKNKGKDSTVRRRVTIAKVCN